MNGRCGLAGNGRSRSRRLLMVGCCLRVRPTEIPVLLLTQGIPHAVLRSPPSRSPSSPPPVAAAAPAFAADPTSAYDFTHTGPRVTTVDTGPARFVHEPGLAFTLADLTEQGVTARITTTISANAYAANWSAGAPCSTPSASSGSWRARPSTRGQRSSRRTTATRSRGRRTRRAGRGTGSARTTSSSCRTPGSSTRAPSAASRTTTPTRPPRPTTRPCGSSSPWTAMVTTPSP